MQELVEALTHLEIGSARLAAEIDAELARLRAELSPGEATRPLERGES